MNHGLIRFLIYAFLGVLVGALVSLVDWLTVEVALGALLAAPVPVKLVLPAIGMLVVALIMRFWPGADSKTSEAYVTAYHSGTGAEGKSLIPKLVASFATIGSGGAVGMEGPAVVAGATIGQTLGDRIPGILGERPRLVLLVAGAAAGIAAIFKAPATGVLFAIEVPYARDISRHGLIPALIASATSYLTFVTIRDDVPLFAFPEFAVELTDELVAAVGIGLVAGVVARGLARGFHWAKGLNDRYPFKVRWPVGSVVLAGAFLIANQFADRPVTLGLGSDITTEIVRDNEIELLAIVVLFAMRTIATGATLGMGGVGGLFIPLVVQGLLLGRAVELAVGAPSTGLYPVIGLAAVLGAAYRIPLAAIMFVAETTGRAEFVIPALVATAIAQSLMGDDSVAVGQRTQRRGQLERRLVEPSSAVMRDDLGTVSPDTSLMEVIDTYGDRGGSFAVPVADPGYKGLLVLHDLATAMLEHGPESTVRVAMRELPSVAHDAPAIDAARLMNKHDTAAIAVVDNDGKPVGVISTTSLAGLHEAEIGVD